SAERRGLEHIDVTNGQRPARDDPEAGARFTERLNACTRQAVAALRGLVWIGGSADHDLLAPPRRPRQLRAQHFGHVDLDADALAVAVVRGPVGAALECSHVAERAAIGASPGGVE